MATPIHDALVDQLYRRADAGRWQLPIDDFARALDASAAKAFLGSRRGSERAPRPGAGQGQPSPRDLERYLGSLRLEELALACACAAGHEGAWDHFVLEYRPVLYRAADAMDPGGGARELADSLYADLFGLQADGGERRSLFRYFHGRSSLATWLRAVLAQRLIDRSRARARTAPLPDEEPEAPPQQAPDSDQRRSLALVHAALRDAVARLEPRDRLRLLYYYAQGLTLAQTGRLLHEHEASVSRRLAAARKTIRHDVERRLREAALGPDEIARCFEYVSEDAGPLDLDRMLSDASLARRGGPRWRTAQPALPCRVAQRPDLGEGGTARNPASDVQSENRENKILQTAPKGRMRR